VGCSINDVGARAGVGAVEDGGLSEVVPADGLDLAVVGNEEGLDLAEVDPLLGLLHTLDTGAGPVDEHITVGVVAVLLGGDADQHVLHLLILEVGDELGNTA